MADGKAIVVTDAAEDAYERSMFKRNYQDPLEPDAPIVHFDILNLRMWGVKSHKEIKRRLGLPASSDVVHKVLNHGPYMRWMRQRVDEIFQQRFKGMMKLQEGFEAAATELLRIMSDGEDDRVKLRAIELYFKNNSAGLPLDGHTDSETGDDEDSAGFEDEFDAINATLETTASPVEPGDGGFDLD